MEKHQGRTTSLRARLILAFIITSIIPAIILNLFSYYNTSGIVKDNVDEMTRSNLSQTRGSLDVWLESYEDILFQIYTDDDIVALLKNLNEKKDRSVSRSSCAGRCTDCFIPRNISNPSLFSHRTVIWYSTTF